MSESSKLAPRIEPGATKDIGLLNTMIAWYVGRRLGTPKLPNFCTTFGKHRTLFRRWMLFGAALMPNGRLPADDREIVILRVAHLADSPYEWKHHVRIGKMFGLTDEVIDGLCAEPVRTTSPWHQALVGAVDDLHQKRTISDEHWAALRERYDEAQMIELCFLVGQYQMFSLAIHAIAVRPDFA